MDKEDPDYMLRGKTLRVYLYLLKHKEPLTMSEVQRALGLSSPSLALHHLEKLVRLGVVSRDEHGRFKLERKIDVSILEGFVSLGSVFLPRFAFYTGFFTVIAAAYIVFHVADLSIFALIGTVGCVAVFAYESLRAWKRRPVL